MSEGIARFRHIAIEGPIGAGKTSLARRLSGRLGAELLLEQPEENPFLDRFYADMPGYAFQTQLFFLFQRQRQVRKLAQAGMFAPAVVSDFALAKDAIFARLTLSDEEHRLYAQMYAEVASQVPEPDVVIWLRASPRALLARVRGRAIRMEQTIEPEYLERLCDAYAAHFAGYDGAPVLVVDTEEVDLIERGGGPFESLVAALAAFDGRRGSLGAAGLEVLA